MPAHRAATLLVLLLTMFAQPASAFVGPPYLTPPQPTADDAIFVNVYSDQCDVVDVGIPWPPPVTRQGNQITILFTGIHEEDPEFCYFGAGTSAYPVGTFPPGSYTLDVERRYGSFSGSWVQETLGILQFTVAAGASSPPAPVSAPTLGIPGLSILLFVLASLAAWCLHSRRS